MEIQRALQISKREWENIKASLEMCGDIGEFDPKNYMDSRFVPVSEGLLLVRNLIEMENKLPTLGYLTPEAAYVFTTLVSRAGERLGLIEGLAKTFGSGYSLVRTGCFHSNRTEKQRLDQMVFFKLFFTHGVGFNWKFNSPLVRAKLKTVFDKFVEWQGDPGIYIQDLENYKVQPELF